jgi:lysozyme
MDLVTQLKRDEGLRLKAYKDTLGVWTIGYGHTGTAKRSMVITKAEAEALLVKDIENAKAIAKRIDFFDKLDPIRQAAIINMCFQLGNKIFQFKRTLAAIRDEKYYVAESYGLESLWAKQTPNRAKRVMRQIATGEWQ